MNRRNTRTTPKAALRKQAEERLEQRAPDEAEKDELSSFALRHELDVTRVELEMQIDEVMRVQNEMEISRDRHIRFMDSMPVGFIVLSRHGVVLHTNRSMTEMLGLKKEDILGRVFSRFVHKSDQNKYYLIVHELFQSLNTQIGQIRIGGQDGRMSSCLCHASMNRDDDKPTTAFLTFTVISNNRLSSHPISDEPEIDNDLITQDKMMKIRSAARSGSVTALSSRLIDFVMAIQTHLLREVVNTTRIVRRVVRTIARDSGRKVNFRIGSLPDCTGNPILIEEVFVNLIDNAMKATRKLESPTISVTGNIEEDSVIFSVRDTGIGFDAASSDRLFRIFEKLHDAADFAGYGVGLAIVKEIVQKHGGRVWAESHMGSTTFSFALPIERKGNKGGGGGGVTTV